MSSFSFNQIPHLSRLIVRVVIARGSPSFVSFVDGARLSRCNCMFCDLYTYTDPSTRPPLHPVLDRDLARRIRPCFRGPPAFPFPDFQVPVLQVGVNRFHHFLRRALHAGGLLRQGVFTRPFSCHQIAPARHRRAGVSFRVDERSQRDRQLRQLHGAERELLQSLFTSFRGCRC